MVAKLRAGKALDNDNAEQEVFELTKIMDVELEEAASIYHEVGKKHLRQYYGNAKKDLKSWVTPMLN